MRVKIKGGNPRTVIRLVPSVKTLQIRFDSNGEAIVDMTHFTANALARIKKFYDVEEFDGEIIEEPKKKAVIKKTPAELPKKRPELYKLAVAKAKEKGESINFRSYKTEDLIKYLEG
jgi:hypothetical protein